jgi:hypothetical protein
VALTIQFYGVLYIMADHLLSINLETSEVLGCAM